MNQSPERSVKNGREYFLFLEKTVVGWRRWRVRLLTFILTLFILFGINDWIPYPGPARDIKPSPTPLNPAIGSLFYVQDLPAWSAILLDGKPLRSLPTLQSQMPVQITRGVHQLEWKAEPFISFHCTLSVPPTTAKNLQEPCQTRSSYSALGPDNTFLIVIPVSLQLLPDSERTTLTQTVQKALDSAQNGQSDETLQKGDHYALTSDPLQIETASEPMIVTSQLQLHTDLTQPASCTGLSLDRGCTISGQDCRSFCVVDSWPSTEKNPSQWNIAALFHENRRYTPGNGQLVNVENKHLDQFVTLSVFWHDGRWSASLHKQMDSPFDDPVCLPLMTFMEQHTGYNQPASMLREARTVFWNYTSSNSYATSCLATGSVGQGEQDQSKLLLFWRAGTLLTANERSKTVWPILPQATDNEMQIIQSLAGKKPG